MHIFPTTIITEPPRFRSQRELIFDRHCGDGWAGTYSHIHAAALTANPPRLLRVHPRGGLGNNLDAIVTLFYWAILSNRALIIMPKADVRFESVFDSPFINWTDDGQNVANNSRFFDLVHAEQGERDEELYEALHSRNLTELHTDVSVLDIALGAPLFHVIFTNPNHRQQMYTWGLSPETAFGCALRYLFRPNEQVRTRFAEEFERLADKSVFKIGIHARFGDAVFQGGSGKLDDREVDIFDDEHLGHIFRCAQHIEEHKALPGQVALWYVISDAREFRSYALREFGAKVFSRANDSIEHIDFLDANASEGNKVHALAMAVGEYWIYSMADFHVIALPLGSVTYQYASSSFSNGAASASLRWGSATQVGAASATEKSCIHGLHRAQETWGDPDSV